MFFKIPALFKRVIDKAMLGRWETTTCEKINAIKVYWANTDHCGTCKPSAPDSSSYNSSYTADKKPSA